MSKILQRLLIILVTIMTVFTILCYLEIKTITQPQIASEHHPLEEDSEGEEIIIDWEGTQKSMMRANIQGIRSDVADIKTMVREIKNNTSSIGNLSHYISRIDNFLENIYYYSSEIYEKI